VQYHMQEPALAPVTPGAGQPHKERFGMPAGAAGATAQRRSPLQDALDHAAAEGMQGMLPAQGGPLHQPGSASGTCEESGMPEALVAPQCNTTAGKPAQQDIAQHGTASRPASGSHEHERASLRQQPAAVEDIIEPEQEPSGDLPLTSLFGHSGEVVTQQGSGQHAGSSGSSERPSPDCSAAPLSASQDSNQENQRPQEGAIVHR
jgi:hypothetical protein